MTEEEVRAEIAFSSSASETRSWNRTHNVQYRCMTGQPTSNSRHGPIPQWRHPLSPSLAVLALQSEKSMVCEQEPKSFIISFHNLKDREKCAFNSLSSNAKFELFLFCIDSLESSICKLPPTTNANRATIFVRFGQASKGRV